MTVTQPDKTGMNLEQLWNAVMARDKSLDGCFVYAVRSTGVYCRPTCPSRRPRREQVCFFPTSEEARKGGYRACRRCLPDRPSMDEELIRMACNYINEYVGTNETPPQLTEISEAVGVTPTHLRREFKRETGLTPLQYARGKRMERFKSLLREGANVSEALYDAGYGSSSRLYENANEQLGMTPASYRKGGAGALIRYIITESALGGLLVAGTDRGVCAVKLGDNTGALVAELEQEFPSADIRAADLAGDSPESAGLRGWTSAAVAYLDGRSVDINLPLDVRATMFQWRVWRQLQAIPVGETRSYQQLAEELKQPRASRAVGHACATNPVAPIIPCHRALRKDGGLGGYRWGLHRKETLLAMERHQSARPAGHSLLLSWGGNCPAPITVEGTNDAFGNQGHGAANHDDRLVPQAPLVHPGPEGAAVQDRYGRHPVPGTVPGRRSNHHYRSSDGGVGHSHRRRLAV